ncbi:MAG: glucosidase [Proteobacteria bacterium]|nr:glucosidase [Pseudomonadota bacterium]
MPPRPSALFDTAEGQRLVAARASPAWRDWGPYLSERQWGTVREDYSPNGDSWDYVTHDQARSRAYRWGEDGLAGFGDRSLRWCLGLALWNGQDPILKERLFGLANEEGNHGEDVKELYYYLDATPTHSYMRMLYKYPQAAFPYDHLVAENHRRGYDDPEYELIDTGIFDEARYFDVFVEYAKGAPDDILMRVTIANRGPDAARLHVLPQLWARNIWDWTGRTDLPEIAAMAEGQASARHPELPEMRFAVGQEATFLFCDNETNRRRIYAEHAAPGPFKDGINDYLVGGDADAIRAEKRGTKCAAHHVIDIPGGGETVLKLRFRPTDKAAPDFDDFDAVFAARQSEADAFYEAVHGKVTDADARLVQRQAFAGMLWSKQLYNYAVRDWLIGDPAEPPPPESRWKGRNADWLHLRNDDIISMPDKWEYPWYASWDLGFQTLALAAIDPDFAKGQLLLLVGDDYMHPNAQLPAYEYGFGDANPPVHAWAAWRVFMRDRDLTGEPDYVFLKRILNKLALNFTWWVNRRDAGGRNIFQGGFLGLDNIGIFDRSSPVPNGGTLSQSDATAWMAMYALNLMRISIELALIDGAYQDMAIKFFEHFLYIAEAAAKHGGLWDEEDEFFYDRLEYPDGREVPIRTRTMVGLIPLFAVEVLRVAEQPRLPDMIKRMRWFLDHRPDLEALVSHWDQPGQQHLSLMSMLRGHRMKCLLRRMLDETEFLSPHGIRAVSKVHEAQPYVFSLGDEKFTLPYWPAESHSGLFGGNSNWRGPVWMPVNYLIIDSLRQFHSYYGEDFRVECPTNSGTMLNLNEIADELSRRLTRLFLKDKEGRRAVHGDHPLLQTDPHFRDLPLFYEYFDGDNGRGVGASHQTGWTGLVALLIAEVAG